MGDLRAGPGLRLARALVTATVAGGLGIGAHATAGGLLPSMTWLIVIYLTLTAAAIVSMGRPAGTLRLVVLVGGGQFATHVVLTALAGHDGDHRSVHAPLAQEQTQASMADVGSDRRGSLYDLTVGSSGQIGGGEFVTPHWMTHILDDLTGPHAVMAVAHLAAAAIVAWWLAQGERALWTVLVLLGASVAQALLRLIAVHDEHPLLARPQASRTVGARQPCRPLAPLTGGLGRRGPPLIAI